MTPRILVCGGRHFEKTEKNWRWFRDHMERIFRERDWVWDHEYLMPRGVIIHGASPAGGIDWMADDLATVNWLETDVYPPEREDIQQWGFPIAAKMRNQRMLDKGMPNLVVVFPGGRGTADMKERALRAGVEVIEIER